MTKEQAWQRHLERVRRLTTATDKPSEAKRIKAELINEGYRTEVAERIVRESWNYARGKANNGNTR